MRCCPTKKNTGEFSIWLVDWFTSFGEGTKSHRRPKSAKFLFRPITCCVLCRRSSSSSGDCSHRCHIPREGPIEWGDTTDNNVICCYYCLLISKIVVEVCTLILNWWINYWPKWMIWNGKQYLLWLPRRQKCIFKRQLIQEEWLSIIITSFIFIEMNGFM